MPLTGNQADMEDEADTRKARNFFGMGRTTREAQFTCKDGPTPESKIALECGSDLSSPADVLGQGTCVRLKFEIWGYEDGG